MRPSIVVCCILSMYALVLAMYELIAHAWLSTSISTMECERLSQFLFSSGDLGP